MDMKDLLPVLLGSDANVYGMARSFYMEYGVTSLAIGKGALAATANSRLVKMAVVKEPMLVTSGMKVLMTAPSNMGTTIIPAGIFFRNRMIMGFFLLVFLVSP